MHSYFIPALDFGGSSTPPAFTPSSLSPLQWALDGGATYETVTVDNLAVLRSLESYGTYRKPRAGRCALFDGTNDCAVITDASLCVSGDLTIAGWIKTTSTAEQTICGCGDAGGNDYYGLKYDGSSGKLELWHNGAVAVARSDVLSIFNTRTHVAAVRSGSSGNWTIKFYVNGALAGQGTTATNPSGTGTQQFAIGRWGSYIGTLFFSGSIDDVRVYNVAKSAAEVLAIKNQASTPTTIDHTGILGHWWLNEEAGTTAYDCSGNGKNLTITNATTPTPFHATDTGVGYNPANWLGHGQALSFNGSGDYGTIPDQSALRLTSDLTIAFWVKFNSVSGTQFLVSKESATGWATGYSVFLNANRLNLLAGNGSSAEGGVTSTASPVAGVWYHVAVVRSGTTYSLYINGTLDNSATYSATTITDTGTSTSVGKRNTGVTGLLSGAMTDIRLYSSAKIASEVAAIKAGTNDTTNLVAHWKYNQNDQSGNGRNLTLTGTTALVLPRNEASTSLDAAGVAMLHTGKCPHPAVVETPCITGDGTAVYVDLSSVASTLGDVDETEWWFYTPSDITAASGSPLIGSTNPFRTLAYLGPFSGSIADETLTVVSSTTDVSAATFIKDTIPAGWNKVKYVWSASLSRYRIYLNGIERTVYSSTSHAAKLSNIAAQLLAYSTHSVVAALRIASFSITTAGVTTHFILQGGPGSSNTNRDIYWVKTDDTYGVISGAIVNGTVSNIWANRCPGYVQDWCVNYGGRLTTENLLKYSEQLDNASIWNKTTNTVTANAAADPNGNSTAELVSFVNGAQLYQNIAGLSSGSYTFSAYVKKNAYRYFSMQTESNTITYRAVFDLDTATFTVNANTSATMTDAGNGWYRCTVTNTAADAITYGTFQQSSAATFASGSGTNSFYVWGAQMNAGSSAVDYQPTTSTAIPANAFVPGQISGTLAADGLTKSLAAGNHGNPNSRRSPNPWDAPELRSIGYTPTTLYAPGDDVQSVSPTDTKFRRSGTDGEDRTIAVATALIGTDKTDMESYVA